MLLIVEKKLISGGRFGIARKTCFPGRRCSQTRVYQRSMSNFSNFLSFGVSLSFLLPVMLSCFLFFCVSLSMCNPRSLVQAVSFAVWRSSSRRGPESSRWATRAQQGSSTANQFCTVWPYNTLIFRELSLSFFLYLLFSFSVSLILCLLNADRQKDTQYSSEGRAFVPGSQFALVLLCFTV